MRRKREIGQDRILSPFFLVLLVLSFTLIFWLTVVWVIPGRSLIDIQRFWSSPGYPGLSLFAASTFIVLLLLYLLIAESLVARRSGNSLTVGLCLICALPLAAIGSVLLDLAQLSVYQLLWERDGIDEPFDAKGQHLGRVLHESEENPTRYLQVALEDGTTVLVSAIPRYTRPSESAYVVVQRFSGRRTSTLCHQLISYLPAGDLDLLTERRLEAMK